MLKFKAILSGVPTLERPVQVFGSSREFVTNWAKETARKFPVEKFPGRRVEVVEVVERVVEVIEE